MLDRKLLSEVILGASLHCCRVAEGLDGQTALPELLHPQSALL